VSERRV